MVEVTLWLCGKVAAKGFDVCPADDIWIEKEQWWIYSWLGKQNCWKKIVPVNLFTTKSVWNSLGIKPTDALNYNFVDITTLHVSGSLYAHHQEFLALHRLWYILCCCDDRFQPGAGWNCSSILLLVANGSSQLHKMCQCRCTAKNSWWWAERLPKTCRVVIPTKLELSASVGFVHKEFVTMHGHTIVKNTQTVRMYVCTYVRTCVYPYDCFQSSSDLPLKIQPVL